MAIRNSSLTIFQKMLVAPLIGLLLYSAYLGYSYSEHRHSSSTIEQIRDGYLPVLELTGENVLLFTNIVDDLKDAVQANEPEWVTNTRIQSEQIENNLQHLAAYPQLLPPQELTTLRILFHSYYKNAYAFSEARLNQHTSGEEYDQLIENMNRYYGQASAAFDNMKLGVQQRLSQQVEETNRRFHRLLLLGVAMGLLLIVLITAISFALSLSTRRSLSEINRALKNIAQESPDFSARLQRNSDDELGELVGWFNLLTEKLERDYKKIETLSITDKLTQLYNRTKIDELFQMEISKAARYHEPLSVIMLDLDHFKSVNDNHGHQVGDRVLQELAAVLQENVRDCDHLGRWGGEEFIIIAPNTDLSHARQQAEKLRQAIADFNFSVVRHKSGSLGVASYHDSDSEESLSKRADDCLYLAKERGRNRVVDESEL